MDKTSIDYLRKQRKRHLEAIMTIQQNAEIFLQQYQEALDAEIQGVEYCEQTLTDAGVPVEEEVEELAEETPNDDCGANDGATE